MADTSFDLIVMGGGPGGYVAAIRAAAMDGACGPWSTDATRAASSSASSSFADAIAFVVRIGFLAEAADHHPDLEVRWRRVRVALTTHDAGGLTTNDFDLARQIEEVA